VGSIRCRRHRFFCAFPEIAGPPPFESKSNNVPNRAVDRPKGARVQTFECIFVKRSGAIRETSRNRQLERRAEILRLRLRMTKFFGLRTKSAEQTHRTICINGVIAMCAVTLSALADGSFSLQGVPRGNA
jgi:hypothetical protein